MKLVLGTKKKKLHVGNLLFHDLVLAPKAFQLKGHALLGGDVSADAKLAFRLAIAVPVSPVPSVQVVTCLVIAIRKVFLWLITAKGLLKDNWKSIIMVMFCSSTHKYVF